MSELDKYEKRHKYPTHHGHSYKTRVPISNKKSTEIKMTCLECGLVMDWKIDIDGDDKDGYYFNLTQIRDQHTTVHNRKLLEIIDNKNEDEENKKLAEEWMKEHQSDRDD